MKVAFSKKVILFSAGVMALSVLSIGIVNATGDRFGYWSQPITTAQTVKTFAYTFSYSDILKKGARFKVGTLPRNTQINSVFLNMAVAFKTNDPAFSYVASSVSIADDAEGIGSGALFNTTDYDLTRKGVTFPLAGGPAYQANVINPVDVFLNFAASDSSGEALSKLAAGKATLYITYINF